MDEVWKEAEEEEGCGVQAWLLMRFSRMMPTNCENPGPGRHGTRALFCSSSSSIPLLNACVAFAAICDVRIAEPRSSSWGV
ncbi:hypothetical protein KEM55_006989 [Ascosphaera atra]|nr:hypothetical protein KEM55_006989 [Ascosphaera atra]